MRSSWNSRRNSLACGVPLPATCIARSPPPGRILAGRAEVAVDAGGQLVGGDAVEVQRDERLVAAVRHAMDDLALEVAVGDVARPVDGALQRLQVGRELLLGQLALGHAERA